MNGNKWGLDGVQLGINPQANRVVINRYIEASGGCGPVLGVQRLLPQGGKVIDEKIPKGQLQFCADATVYENQKTRTFFLHDKVSWITNDSFSVDWDCSIRGAVNKEYKDKTLLSFNGNAWSIDHTPCQTNAAANPSSGITYGMKIVGVRSDSAAAAAGIRPGMFFAHPQWAAD